MDHGHIVAEYEDYSIWVTPVSEPQWIEPTYGTDLDEVAKLTANGYWASFSHYIPVSTYEQALLEPEWMVFQ